MSFASIGEERLKSLALKAEWRVFRAERARGGLRAERAQRCAAGGLAGLECHALRKPPRRLGQTCETWFGDVLLSLSLFMCPLDWLWFSSCFWFVGFLLFDMFGEAFQFPLFNWETVPWSGLLFQPLQGALDHRPCCVLFAGFPRERGSLERMKEGTN